jgi:uncharacterized protein (TIGR02996 family)
MEEESFVRHIREDPRDEVARLIYADYLEDAGDPRGEFIRVQCELARLEVGDPARPNLVEREEQLLEQYSEDWLSPLRDLGAIGVTARCFQRGLIERARMKASDFATHCQRLCAEAPALFCADLRQVTDAIDQLSAAKVPGQIRALDMSSNRLTSYHLRELLRCPWLRQLEQIHLGFNQLGDDGAAALGSIPWGRLRVLALGHNGIGAPGVRALTGGALTTLTSLSLELNRIGPRGAGHLAESANLSDLEELDLAAARIESAGASALARSGTLTSLKRLNLRGNQITSVAVRDLAASPWKLTYLDLRSNSTENVSELKERYGEALVI